MADGTTDISGQEQFCSPPVSLKIQELFLGMFNPSDVTAETLFKTIQTMLIALNLGTDNLRGHCFDGTSTMSGRLTGVQKRLSDLQPKSLFIHWSNHSLDLVLQETARKCDILCDTLAMIREVSNAILESAKRRAIYANIIVRPCLQDQENAAEVVTNIIPLCPTRWTVRVKAMKRFLENYSRIRETLTAILSDSSANITDQRKATLRAFRTKMHKFKTLVALKLSITAFGPCQELARALQSPAYTASGAKHSAQALWDTLHRLGSHDFNEAWEYTLARAEELELKMGERLPGRSRIPPRRFEQIPNPEPAAQVDQKSSLRKGWVAVLDLMKAELHRRFQQPNMDQLVRLETILQKSNRLTNNELADALGVHRTDFDVDRLNAQLVLFPSVIEGDAETVLEIAKSLQALPTTTRKLLDQIVRLVLLLLTVPACSTTLERSFSASTRLKTRLRSTMSHKRLTHLLLLHIHDEYTKTLSLNEMMKEFVSATTERRKVFGTVTS